MGRYVERKSSAHNARNLFCLLQLFVAICVIVTFVGYYYLTKFTDFGILTRASFGAEVHPNFSLPKVISVEEFAVRLYFLVDVFVWSGLFVLLPTIAMGAGFPLIASFAYSEHAGAGRTAGTVYCLNVVGNAIGGLITGFILLPVLGTEQTVLVFIGIGGSFLFMISATLGRPPLVLRRVATAAVVGCTVILLFPGRGDLYSIIHTCPTPGSSVLLEEGFDGVVLAHDKGDRVQVYINGMLHGSRPSSFHAALALKAIEFAPHLENALIIGFGSGIFLDALLKSNQLKQVTLVELSPSLMKNLEKVPPIREIMLDPRLRIIVDDGRRFLIRTKQKFDLIMLDPLRSIEAYSNNLNSREFCRLVLDRLADDGIAFMWQDEQKVLSRTRASVFPYLQKHGAFCLGSRTPISQDVRRAGGALSKYPAPEREAIEALFRTSSAFGYEGDKDYLVFHTRGYPVNEDWRPVTEYFLGLIAIEKFKKLLIGSGQPGKVEPYRRWDMRP